MRLTQLLEQQLFEHNVVNREEISDYVEQFASRCTNPNAQEWFRVTLARWLEKDDQINVKMGDRMPINAPDWVDAAVARGDDLRVFHPPIHLNAALDHLGDYFNWLASGEQRNAEGERRAAETGERFNSTNDHAVLSDRKRVLAVTVETALKKADDWNKSGAKAALKTAVTDVKEVMEDGIYTWVEPTSLEALKRDGAILQNCIGNGFHDDNFTKKVNRYFFLHDRKGEPHVAISFNIKSHELSEVKGKQNDPPVGRYVSTVANFINQKLDPVVAAQNFDIRNMGLTLLPSGKLGHKAETGKLVTKIGDVRVFENDGVDSVIYDRGAGNNKSVGGGKDYSFVSTKDGALFTLNVGSNGLVWIKALEEGNRKRDRELVKSFLNGYFDEAPAPMDFPYNSGAGNKMTYLFGERDGNDQRLESYDYNSKRYGSVQETGKKLATVGEYTCYLTGNSIRHGLVSSSVAVLDPKGKIVEDIPVRDNMSMGQMSYSDDFEPHLAMVPALNAVGITPMADFDSDRNNQWRIAAKLFYSIDKKLWGSMEETCQKLWSGKGFAIYLRHEMVDQSYFMFTKGDERVLELREGEGGTSPPSIELASLGAYKENLAIDIPEPMRAALQAACNECKPFNAALHGRDMQAYDLFESDGKWVRRDLLAKPYHRFDDGSYITEMPSGEDEVYNFYTTDKHLIFALTLKGQVQMRNHQIFGKGQIKVARNVQWLLNHLSFYAEDLVDANKGYNGNSTKAILWSMGLFHDTRSDSWKLVQDGKVFFEGTNFRIVKFRNRYFVVSNDDGCVGYFKIEGVTITDKHTMAQFDTRDFYNMIVEFLDKTEYHMETREEHGRNARRREGFFSPQQGKLARVEDHFPTETTLELPKGFKWVRKAIDDKYHSRETKGAVHGDRYTLVDANDRSIMRASFDGDHLEDAVFNNEDKLGRNSEYTALKEMSDSQKKVLILLLEKLDKKLLPQDARAFGYYRNGQGKYKPLKGNKALEGFLEGKIVFDDGMEFRCDSHSGTEWTLGIEDTREGVEYYERFKPIMKVTLDDDGIDSVKYSKKEAKRSPKTYMPYLHKLLSIFHTIAGE